MVNVPEFSVGPWSVKLSMTGRIRERLDRLDVEPDAVVGVGVKRVGLAELRLDAAGPAGGELVGADRCAGPAVAPVGLHLRVDARQRRVADQVPGRVVPILREQPVARSDRRRLGRGDAERRGGVGGERTAVKAVARPDAVVVGRFSKRAGVGERVDVRAGLPDPQPTVGDVGRERPLDVERVLVAGVVLPSQDDAIEVGRGAAEVARRIGRQDREHGRAVDDQLRVGGAGEDLPVGDRRHGELHRRAELVAVVGGHAAVPQLGGEVVGADTRRPVVVPVDAPEDAVGGAVGGDAGGAGQVAEIVGRLTGRRRSERAVADLEGPRAAAVAHDDLEAAGGHGIVGVIEEERGRVQAARSARRPGSARRCRCRRTSPCCRGRSGRASLPCPRRSADAGVRAEPT